MHERGILLKKVKVNTEIMKSIEGLSQDYWGLVRHTSPAFQETTDLEEIKDNWWYSLIFLFDRTFYRGRSDELSARFEKITINALKKILCEPDEKIPLIDKVLQLYNQGYLDYTKYGYTTKREAQGHSSELKKALDKKYPFDSTKPKKKSITGRKTDREMVIDSLRLVSQLQGYNHSLIKYTIDNVTNENLSHIYDKVTGIRYVGPKTGSLFIRDIVVFYQLEGRLQDDDYQYIQPVDTWVRQMCERFGWAKKNANAKNIVKIMTQECNKADVSLPRFNQGLWYLGSHALDLLLQGFSLH